MENSINRNTARGQEDRISDIPTGGTGVIGNLGVGGGGAGAYGFRGGGGRRRATLQGGGSRKSEASVDRALKWLGHNQRADGSWSAGNGLTSDADVGVTGMAVLSFLAAGHTEKTGKHKIAVMKAIDYLISKQNRSGAVGENSGKPKSGSGYNHAIAGLALSEAYGMARVRKTGVAAQKAVNYSTNVHQKEYSGWRYAPEQDADMAVTGWFISQLKSAKIAGLKVDGKGFQGAIAFLDSVTKSAGLETGRVSYQPGREPTPTMTAVGLVSRQFMGWKRSDPLLVGGANYLMQNLPEWEGGNADLYYWLHGTQGMFQMGGDWWKAWNASLRDMMIERQRKGPPKIDGSWDPVGPWTEGQGRALATALGTLALEVYYRYLPLYKDGPTDGQAAATARKAAQAAKLKRAAEMRRRLEEARRKKAEEERRRKEAADAEKAREVELATAAMNRPPPPVNPFVLTARDRLSTFAMDVDTAAYTIARKHIRSGSLPPRRTVRMEEFVNAFDYNYPTQALNVFNIHLSGCPAPFGRGLTLLKIGVQAKVLGREGRKPAHLIFVVDASGSMDRADRMPLVKQALGMLVGALGPRDRVSLVVFGADERIVIEGVSATKRAEIMGAVNAIQAGGYTNMFEGLARGYEVAARQFRSGEINRVILCSDGVANVGVGEPERMIELTQRFRKRGIDIASGKDAAPGANAGERFVRCMVDTFRGQGVTLTTAGFGSGSYDDDMLERLANSGDGAYVFIDSPAEARRVFVDEMAATLQTVAKDAKIQVEFDPSRVRRYRLIGYENRDVADKDFRNDKIDAGEVGSGQAVTALYEIELAQPSDRSADIGTVYVRYRNTDSGLVEEISTRIRSDVIARKSPSEHPRLFLAACAAETAEVLRGSEHAADGTLDAVERVMVRVANALPLDAKVAELLKLVTEAKAIRGER
jgi:Ca-activated chloride channel family protein